MASRWMQDDEGTEQHCCPCFSLHTRVQVACCCQMRGAPLLLLARTGRCASFTVAAASRTQQAAED